MKRYKKPYGFAPPGVGGAIASRMVQVPENTILVITVVSLAMILTGVIMNFQVKRVCSRS